MQSLYLLLITFLLALMSVNGQNIDELVTDPDYIKSVTFNKKPENKLPLFGLGERFAMTFDDVIGDEADYYYQFEHYDYNWQPSALFKNEFLAGIDDMRIFDYRNSFTTLQPYSHYMLTVPNQFTRGFKVSGNYMIHIYNDSRDLIFSRKFMITEDNAAVGVAVRRARDLNYVNNQQRIELFVDSQTINFIAPQQTVNVAIYQNADLNTAIYNIKPQFIVGNKLMYRYDAETSFWAGNEFLNFENRDFRAPNINIDYVTRNILYDAFLFTDVARAVEAYTFFPDINGNFLVTTLDNEDNSVQAEYVNIHFRFDAKQVVPDNASIYIMGNYNVFQLQPENRMSLNKRSGLYEATLLLKQGFYNYRYSLVYDDGSIDSGFFSGNKWETENEYTVLAYYRELGARYDRLIGVGSGNSVNITN
jgi:hypothetical protein